MTEWGVVGVIVVLAGLIGIFVKVTISYSEAVGELKTSIAILNTSMIKLTKEVEELSDKSSKRRDDIFCRLSNDEKIIADHETRITILEKHKSE